MKHVIVVHYVFDRSWLQLTRDERAVHEKAFQEEIVGPYVDRLSVRHFDAEAYAVDFSDFLLIETDDMRTYYHFIETLRDSRFIAEGWVRIERISIGIEDGYKDFEKETGNDGA